jgi:hypothetical protein
MLNQTPCSLRGSLALCGVAERDSNNDWGFKLLAYPRFGLSTYRPVFQRVVETAHPYADNSNLSWELNFPGALDVVVEFDGNSRTESNYDYVFFRIGGLCVSARYCGGDCLQRAAYCGVCVCVCACRWQARMMRIGRVRRNTPGGAGGLLATSLAWTAVRRW